VAVDWTAQAALRPPRTTHSARRPSTSGQQRIRRQDARGGTTPAAHRNTGGLRRRTAAVLVGQRAGRPPSFPLSSGSSFYAGSPAGPLIVRCAADKIPGLPCFRSSACPAATAGGGSTPHGRAGASESRLTNARVRRRPDSAPVSGTDQKDALRALGAPGRHNVWSLFYSVVQSCGCFVGPQLSYIHTYAAASLTRSPTILHFERSVSTSD
jgi:hypothetical protein